MSNAECGHVKVTRFRGQGWRCDTCTLEFAPTVEPEASSTERFVLWMRKTVPAKPFTWSDVARLPHQAPVRLALAAWLARDHEIEPLRDRLASVCVKLEEKDSELQSALQAVVEEIGKRDQARADAAQLRQERDGLEGIRKRLYEQIKDACNALPPDFRVDPTDPDRSLAECVRALVAHDELTRKSFVRWRDDRVCQLAELALAACECADLVSHANNSMDVTAAIGKSGLIEAVRQYRATLKPKCSALDTLERSFELNSGGNIVRFTATQWEELRALLARVRSEWEIR